MLHLMSPNWSRPGFPGDTPATLLSRASVENAIVMAMAMGCSTNAIIHLVAMSRWAGKH